jgi:hypothetical protein
MAAIPSVASNPTTAQPSHATPGGKRLASLIASLFVAMTRLKSPLESARRAAATLLLQSRHFRHPWRAAAPMRS